MKFRRHVGLATLIVLCLMLPKRSFSQIEYGIKGGMNFATAVDKNFSTDFSVATFFHAGTFLIVPTGKGFSAKAEILYSVKGTAFPSSATLGSGTIQLKYLSLPLLVNYNFYRKFAVELGPELNNLTSAIQKTAGNSLDVSPVWNNKFDVCVDAGLSYKFNSRLTSSLRYSYGLKGVIRSMVNRTSAYNPSYENHFMNRVFR
jgi:outer membrane immunogenic protein